MVFPSCLIVSIILIDIGNICDNNIENRFVIELGFLFFILCSKPTWRFVGNLVDVRSDVCLRLNVRISFWGRECACFFIAIGIAAKQLLNKEIERSIYR